MDMHGIPHEFMQIAERWSELSEELRQAIIRLVK